MVHKPASLPLASLSSERPTRVRYGVLFCLCTLALVLYLDRVCIGQAEKSIRDELELSKPQMGWIAMAFTLAYTLFEVPVGHWGDRFGSRGVIARIVIWWSAFTSLTGMAWNFSSLVAVRFLFGAGEAGAFPNAARVVTRWFPPQHGAKARSAITAASLVGGAMAPIAAAYFIGLVGWRWTFAIFGGVGVVWAVAFYAWFRDDPATHPGVNGAERTLIGAGRPQSDVSPTQHLRIPWSYVLRSPNVWLMGSIITVGASLFYVLFTWFPTYLKEGRGLSESASGWLTSLVMTGGAVGCLSGGYLADWIVRRTGERRWSRRVVGGGSFLIAAAFVALIPLCPSATLAALLRRRGAIVRAADDPRLVVRGGGDQRPAWRVDVRADELAGRHRGDGRAAGHRLGCGVAGKAGGAVFPGLVAGLHRWGRRALRRRRVLAAGRCDAVGGRA